MNSAAPPSADSHARWRFLRDVIVFQLKMLLDNVRDFALMPISLIAAALDLVFKSDRAPSAYPTDAGGNIKEEGAGVALVSDGDNIDPGGSQTRTIDLAPGKYLFVCNIAGHFKLGMFSVVTVAP